MTNLFQFDRVLAGISDLLPSQVHFSQGAASILIASIWQGAIVAMGMVLCLRLAPRTAAAHRFLLWTAGFAVVACLPFLPQLVFLLSHTPASSTTNFVQDSSASRSWLVIDLRWSVALTAIWAAASLFRLFRLGTHALHLRSLWQTATPVELPQGCASLPPIYGRKPIHLCTSTELERPSVIGFFAPRILIPAWLFPELTASELDQIVLHETEHLRRADDWSNLLQKLVLVLFPFNPALLWMERRLCLEREMACDEAVVRKTQAPRAYASCLTRLAEQSMRHRHPQTSLAALSLGAWQRRPELVQRIQSLLLRKKTLNSFAASSLSAGLIFSIALGAVELARCPQLVTFVSPDIAAANSSQPDVVLVGHSKIQAHELSVQSVASSRPRMIELKAMLPAESPAHSNRLFRPSSRVGANSQFSRIEKAEPVLRQPVPDAEIAEVAPETAREGGWIVLTTWEQVAPAEQNPNPEAEAQSIAQIERADGSATLANQPDPTTGNGSVASEPAAKVTVTRMVLRVIPTSFVSPSPAVVASRNGWLVFHL